jgi:predicted metal-dependent hydrolase
VVWEDGVSLPYLGGTLQVRIDAGLRAPVFEPAPDAAGEAKPAATLRLALPQQAGAQQMRDAVQSWLQRQARIVFEPRCQHFARQLGVAYTRLSLSSAQTRWGSASSNGTIRLNWRLIHFPMSSIDYVVAHELAHLREMNHSPRFWDVVRSVLPDYENLRGTLRGDGLPVFD